MDPIMAALARERQQDTLASAAARRALRHARAHDREARTRARAERRQLRLQRAQLESDLTALESADLAQVRPAG